MRGAGVVGGKKASEAPLRRDMAAAGTEPPLEPRRFWLEEEEAAREADGGGAFGPGRNAQHECRFPPIGQQFQVILDGAHKKLKPSSGKVIVSQTKEQPCVEETVLLC